MKSQVQSVSVQGTNYVDVIKQLTELVNDVLEKLEDKEMTVKDIKYEQSIKSYTMQAQQFYITAFVHFKN